MRSFGIWLGSLAAIAMAGSQAGLVEKEIEVPFRPAGLEAHDTHAAASLLGQFRTSISSWMWLRTDLYLHNGVEMRRLTRDEERAGKTGVGGVDDGHEHLHDDDLIVTVVPAKEDDFRGIFGDIERATKAYKDMAGHGHNDPEDALPLFRLMTWIDPQFINGWTTGAIVMARQRDEVGTQKALAFLHEGLAKNPQSIDILTQIGYLTITRKRDLEGALPFLEQARAIGIKNLQMLSEQELEALNLAYRWLGLSCRDIERPAELSGLMKEALRIFPDDPVLSRLLTGGP
jgi:hypothetical protein